MCCLGLNIHNLKGSQIPRFSTFETMKSEKDYTIFYERLKSSLPSSSGAQRKVWAMYIIEKKISVRDLSCLLLLEYKIASRFLWLLTDIAELDKKALEKELVFLFDLCSPLDHIRIEASFANYWLICGVPIEKEAECIDWLFKWLQSPEMNVTTKSRSLFVLFNLTQKYPEMTNEFKLVLGDQLEINTNEFKKRAKKILLKLESQVE